MSPKRIWTFVIGFLAILSLWFGVPALYQFYIYKTLSAEATAIITEMSPRELRREHFVPLATYSFDVKGTTYTGESLLSSTVTRNLPALEDLLPQLKAEEWTVWYRAEDPNQSTLEKNLPIRESISTFMLLGLMIYFIWLREQM